MRNALDAVAHDLRTPIARLRGRAEQALLAPPEVDRYREALEDTVEEADRVSALLTTLMDISEAEAGTMQLRREPVDVARVLQETLDLYEDLAEARGVRLAMEAPSPGLTVNADYARLRQALANLVDNAVKYTPAGGSVTVGAESRPGAVALSCGTPGPGIPEQQQDESGSGCIGARRARKNAGLGWA